MQFSSIRHSTIIFVVRFFILFYFFSSFIRVEKRKTVKRQWQAIKQAGRQASKAHCFTKREIHTRLSVAIRICVVSTFAVAAAAATTADVVVVVVVVGAAQINFVSKHSHHIDVVN